MKSILLSITLLATSLSPLFAQDYKMSIGIDVTRTTVLDPTIRFEHAVGQPGSLRSIYVWTGYQIEYNSKFGLLGWQSWGSKTDRNYLDDISLGVYQGPSLKVGYAFGKKARGGSYLFALPAFGFKYQWYNDVKVFHDWGYTSRSSGMQYQGYYRLQSARCISLLPQLNVGIKRVNKHFFSEVQAGLSCMLKFRTRTIDYWREQAVIVPTPVDDNDNIIMPGLVLSFAMGYIR